MAYRCSGRTNVELVNNLFAQGLIKSERVADVFKKVDRKNYVLDERDAYIDTPQAIPGYATISAPHMHAEAITNLLPFLRPGARVLDVGSGSGYLCALFHHLVSPPSDTSAPAAFAFIDAPPPSASTHEQKGLHRPDGGHVVGIDHIPELVTWSVHNLRKDNLGAALDGGGGDDARQIDIVVGDGREGYVLHAPYDAIHVGAAAPTLPQALVDQLGAPGRMFIPVGTTLQRILQVDKDAEGNVSQKALLHVQYIPLTDRGTQESRGWR